MKKKGDIQHPPLKKHSPRQNCKFCRGQKQRRAISLPSHSQTSSEQGPIHSHELSLPAFQPLTDGQTDGRGDIADKRVNDHRLVTIQHTLPQHG